MKKMLVYFCLLSAWQFSIAQTKQDMIKRYFSEIKEATKNETNLWGEDLYGPILLVNPASRQVYSNFADAAGLLKQTGEIYTGTLPAAINIANTSVDWNGKRWAMILLPLPAEKANRINLLAHELFHKSQPSLGFRLSMPDNNHLDEKEGRIYLRLELEALKRALSAKGRSRQTHLENAIRFRQYRYLLYPGADSTENALELNEGLAEYTGLMISKRNRTATVAHFEESLKDFLSNPTFVRSFAYQTVPMYGYLLYALQKDWNRRVNAATRLTDFFVHAFNTPNPAELKQQVEKNSSTYNGTLIITEETVRATKIKELVAAYKKKFTEEPHFEISFEKMNISYDPRNIMPVEDKGTYYPNIRISDNWGILTVTNGALLGTNWDKISITNPGKIEGKILSGDGWTLTLTEGYSVVKDGNDMYKLIKN